MVVDCLESGKGDGARAGIGRRNIERPHDVGVERMGESLGVGEAEGGELGIGVSLGGGHEVFPAIDAETAEAAEEYFGSAFDDFAEPGGGFHLLGAEAFVSAAHIPEKVAGWFEGDGGSGEIDGFHAEVEFVIDSREAGEALAGGLSIEEVFRPLGLDGNEVGGDFLSGEFAGPDEGAELVDGGGGSGFLPGEADVFEVPAGAGEIGETLDDRFHPAIGGEAEAHFRQGIRDIAGEMGFADVDGAGVAFHRIDDGFHEQVPHDGLGQREGVDSQERDVDVLGRLPVDGDGCGHLRVAVVGDVEGGGFGIEQAGIGQAFEGADFLVGMPSEAVDEAVDFVGFEALGEDAGSSDPQRLVFLFAFDAVEAGDELNGREQLQVECFKNFGCLGQELLVPGDEIPHLGNDGMGHMTDVRDVLR